MASDSAAFVRQPRLESVLLNLSRYGGIAAFVFALILVVYLIF
jgi:tetrahydromethanopterin S-methyltransferase subunit F